MAISALLRTLPATTIDPIMLLISNTSIDLNFLPLLLFNIVHIFSNPSIRIEGPLEVPPKPLIGSPAPLTHIVEYVNDLPLSKNDCNVLRSNSTHPCLESGTMKSASLVLRCLIDTPFRIRGNS